MKNDVFVQEMIFCTMTRSSELSAEQRCSPQLERIAIRRTSRYGLNSSAPRSLRTPSNPSRDLDYEPFDQPSDDDYSKHFCEKNWHALETRIERFAQSCICFVHALLIFRLICCFPFYSILLRSQTLQCVILSSQSIVTHAQLRAVKLSRCRASKTHAYTPRPTNASTDKTMPTRCQRFSLIRISASDICLDNDILKGARRPPNFQCRYGHKDSD